MIITLKKSFKVAKKKKNKTKLRLLNKKKKENKIKFLVIFLPRKREKVKWQAAGRFLFKLCL